MVVNEQGRHRLYRRLEEVLGQGEATTLMEYLPPVGWADVATKRDLDSLEERVDLRFARVDLRLDQMDRRLDQVDGRFAQVDGRFDRLEEQMRVQFGKLDHTIDSLRSDFRASLLAVMSMMVVLFAAMVAAIKL